MEIEVGSVYKIDHSFSSLPFSLSSIRAVLVEEKTDEDVTLVFPSTKSLERFFGKEKRSGLMQPNLDEKLFVGLNEVEEFLAEKISFEEFAGQRGNKSFWAVDFDDHDHHDEDDHDHGSSKNDVLGIKWGKKRKATFRGDHKSTMLPCISAKKVDDENIDDHEVVSMDEEKDVIKVRTLRKRKCHFKGVKYVEKKKRKQIKGDQKNQKKFVNSQNRWTVDRYKLAEKNMLKIMKAKGAVPGNPILRPDLRAEARKVVGDTGLLDHLLKHMAGKLAPGGKERFRRRHNPEGAMEYWLEAADLVEIRKREGIDDPFWVPPPGWEPGDCPTQDPVCARGLKELREEVANMKREIGKLGCMGQQDNEALMTATAGPESVERLNILGSLKPLKVMYAELLKKKVHVEKQLFDISKSFSEMEEEIGMLKGSVSFPKAMSQVTEKETKGLVEGVREQEKAKRIGGATGAFNEADTSQDKEGLEIQQAPKPEDRAPPPPAVAVTEAERIQKEERRQKLKSGFRICKPQGTFLWPSQMASNSCSSQLMVHLEDLLGYPTPPSVSSSNCRPPSFIYPPPPPPYHHHNNHHQPPSPVKRPVAKRAAVTLAFSTATIRGSTTIESIASPTDTTGSSTVHNFVPDLNEVPSSPFT